MDEMKYTQFNPRPFEAHAIAYEMVPPESSVLDLGTATGYFANELQKKGCKVTGIEFDREAVKLAKKYYRKLLVKDLEDARNILLPRRYFDAVLLLDVLEHLKNRNALLKSIRQWIKPNGFIIISTPNIAHVSIRLKLLLGEFQYTNWGILDKAHVHFFTKKTLKEELEESGWIPEAERMSVDLGQLPYCGRLLRHIPKIIQAEITSLLPTVLGVQFVWKCKTI